MNDIKQIWQQALKEFGNDAAILFDVDLDGMTGWWPAQSNIQVESFLSRNQEWVRLKPLPELFAHDVEVYGENAYLMWEFLNLKEDWIDFEDNSDVDYPNIRRKQSAALPFDLERAKNGGAITWINHDENNFVSCKFISQYDSWRALVEWNDKTRDLVAFVNLRMKYPPKAAR